MRNTTLYVEGNNGGDFLDIEPLHDNLIHLEVGNCCVRTIRAIVPVEFITSLLTEAVLEHNGLKEAMLSVGWADDFKDKLASQIIELDLFNRPVEKDKGK